MMMSQRSVFDDVMERRFSISRENKGMWIVGIIILLGGMWPCGSISHSLPMEGGCTGGWGLFLDYNF